MTPTPPKEPRHLRVDRDSLGWNIVEREEHRYVESCGLLCSVAVKRAIELAGPEGTVEVLDQQQDRYVLVQTPEVFTFGIVHDDRGWTGVLRGPCPEQTFGPEIDPPALFDHATAFLEQRDIERFVAHMDRSR